MAECEWAAGGNFGTENEVKALAVFDDGSGPALYAGGFFTTAGGESANYIAKWNGSSWSPMGSGMDAWVDSLAVFNDTGGDALYAGGNFTTAGGLPANRIAKWNGSTWSALGPGLNAAVYELAIVDDGGGDALYAGGAFNNVEGGGTPLSKIAKWDGSNWSAVGSGTTDASVFVLAVFGPALYAGGEFTTIGGVSADHIAQWDGLSWSALGSGVSGPVNALAVFDDGGGPALYVGGAFTMAGGSPADRLAKWNGSSWSALSSQPNGTVDSLAVFDDGGGLALYAGGAFTAVGAVSALRIAKWNGSTWSALGTGLDARAGTLANFNDGTGSALYAGGQFTTAGGNPSAHFAKWSCGPTRIYVDASATGANDGSSWNDAFDTLQAALSYAATHPEVTEIWVAAGTYKPDQFSEKMTGDRSDTFQLQSGLALYGGFNGDEDPQTFDLADRDFTANETILSGDLSGDDGPNFAGTGENSYHVVTGSGTNNTAVLDGFTITKGNADLAPTHQVGGGMVNSGGSPVTTNCRFLENQAISSGGGMYNILSSSPILKNCDFRGNVAAGGEGGAMRVASNSVPTLVGCTLIQNEAGQGGGIFANTGSSVNLLDCSFFGNTAGDTAGGGVRMASPTTLIATNCAFSGNSAVTSGGAIQHAGSLATITNCTFSGNTAGTSGGGIRSATALEVNNCILWGNSDSGGTDESAQIDLAGGPPPNVDFCDIEGLTGGLGGSGNIGVDPLFVDPDGADNLAGTEDDDLGLSPGSPAIDAANTPALPPDTDDADGDGNTTERYPFDLAGNPRILDDPATVDTGVPGSDVVDMGAYEFFTDCNNNGLPDICDLDCGLPDGPCDLPGCGLDTDCNGNGIPDECEADCNSNMIPDDCDIAGCMGDPACTDCNANGLPDGCELAGNDCNSNFVPDDCDIANCPPDTPSCADCNHNGIPDECDPDVDPVDGLPDDCTQPLAGNTWTTATWDGLDPGEYPDNDDSVPGLHVTLNSVSVDIFLDETVVIETLELLDGATLNMTQSGLEGDLTVLHPDGILNEGNLFIGDGRTIDVSAGAFTVGPGGLYQADPDAMGTVAATLTAASVTLLGVSGAPPSLGGLAGGTVALSGSMAFNSATSLSLIALDKGSGTPPDLSVAGSASVSVGSDLTMQGSSSISYTSTGSFSIAGNLSIIADDKGSGTPPDLNIAGSAAMAVGADVILQGDVSVTLASTALISIGGDFVNQAINPITFDWSGTLLFNGPGHAIEAAGDDRGPCAAGLTNNFALGEFALADDTVVNVIDAFDNQQDAGLPCSEALYVDTLTIGAGAVLNATGCKVYYNTLNNKGKIPGLGTDVMQIGAAQPADLACDGDVGAEDLAQLLGAWGPHPEGHAADLNGDGTVNAADLAQLLGNWG